MPYRYQHNKPFRLKIFSAFFFFVATTGYLNAYADEKPLGVVFNAIPTGFPLADRNKPSLIIHDLNDAEVVGIVIEALRKDIQLVSGLQLKSGVSYAANGYPIVIGTLGKSKLIDELAEKKLIPANNIKGKWETFCLSVVNNPWKDVKQALVIFGSDPRGTAFGVFELSKLIGVSPLVYWADVLPEQHKTLYVTPGKNIVGPPSVQYRGIFINDEDWGLQPWAAKNMDTTIKDIGPRTYEKVFELMLRIKANYLWPAMHPCTKAFWCYPENPVLARKYNIVLGASHCEPLLRNNVFEWTDNFKHEYGITPGEWRYDLNKEQIDHYWNDRVKQSQNNPAVYTVGMRGIHDGSMPGPNSKEEKKKLLETVIRNQREMLYSSLGKPVADIPQLFCPYKEVLDLYRLGMDLPDDITLAWADDNHGYVRQLSNPAEQKRSGGSGVYYHLSYWGAPQDYLWLSSISPMLISYELSKAWALQARRLWIYNVGDIKPGEMELMFGMDLAWDVNAWTPEKAQLYPEHWAAATFGKAFGKNIGNIKERFYRLAASGKPEHLDRLVFTDAASVARLADYQGLVAEVKKLAQTIPARLQDAYYQLVWYPVEAACNMNEKILYARKSLMLAAAGKQEALLFSAKAKTAFENIQLLTEKYNTGIANGKWNGMMSYHPRDLKIFNMPPVATPDMIKQTAYSVWDSTVNAHSIAAAGFVKKSNNDNLKIIEGLGIGKTAVTVWPMDLTTYTDTSITKAPYVEYKLPVSIGENKITVQCLPNFPLYSGMKLRYAIGVDGSSPVFVSIATPAESKAWAVNILRGYATGETMYKSSITGEKIVRIYFPDPGLVLSTISVTGVSDR